MARRFDEFAEKYLNISLRSGPEYMVQCVFHDDSRASMQFNADRGLFVCFTCGMGGGMRKLMAEFGLRSIEESLDVSDILARLDEIDRRDGKPAKDDLPVLPESYLRRFCGPLDYWEDRGLSMDTIKRFGLGSDPLETEIATIPIRNVSGGLLGVIKRDGSDDAPIRYKYPKGFKRSRHMFGSWLVEETDSNLAVVVEGSVDSMMVWEAGLVGLAQYGSTIGRPQIKLMLELGIERVVLLYDNPAIDKAGALAIRYALGWHREKDRKTGNVTERYDPTTDLARFFQVAIGQYPTKPRRVKDPGAMTVSQIQTAVGSALAA
jgi:DNA primase